MHLDQALYEMELVGHDFYLFVDADHRSAERRLPPAGLRLRRHPARRLRPGRSGGHRGRFARITVVPGADVRGCARGAGRGSGAPCRGCPRGVAGERARCRVGPVGSRGARRRRADPGAGRRRPRAVPPRPGDGARPGDATSRSSARPATAPRRSTRRPTLLPDIVLMDVRMPRRSGIEACTAIKDVVPEREDHHADDLRRGGRPLRRHQGRRQRLPAQGDLDRRGRRPRSGRSPAASR